MYPHLVCLCITTSNTGSQSKTRPPYPWGGCWLSELAHLHCFFPTTIPRYSCPDSRLSSPDSQDAGFHDSSFYCKGWRDTYPPLHTRVFTSMAKGYREVTDVLVGSSPKRLRFNSCEKRCVCVHVSVCKQHVKPLISCFHRSRVIATQLMSAHSCAVVGVTH